MDAQALPANKLVSPWLASTRLCNLTHHAVHCARSTLHQASALPLVHATGVRDPELLPLAADYLKIRSVAQPAVLATMVRKAWCGACHHQTCCRNAELGLLGDRKRGVHELMDRCQCSKEAWP